MSTAQIPTGERRQAKELCFLEIAKTNHKTQPVFNILCWFSCLINDVLDSKLGKSKSSHIEININQSTNGPENAHLRYGPWKMIFGKDELKLNNSYNLINSVLN